MRRRGFGLAVAAGVLSSGSGVGLLAVSAWLISRAAQHPPILELSVAVVAVRAFAIGRGAFRYVERLVSHDTALRVLGALRVDIWRRLVPLAPAGLPAYRRGDLLARLVADVDAVQDRYLRVVVPIAVAAVVSVGSVVLAGLLLPSAGGVLVVALLVAALAVPAVTAYAARRGDARVAAARGALTADVVELLRCAPDLVAYGAAEQRLAGLGRTDAELTRIARSSAGATGLGAALAALASGAAMVGALIVGVPAVRSGVLDGVLLAVVVLLPLAAFEAVAGLPVALTVLARVRRAGERIYGLVEAPVPVRAPAAGPVPLPAAPYSVRVSGLVARWPGAPAPALQGVDLSLPAGRRVALVGASGAGKSTLAAVLVRFLDAESGAVTLSGVPLQELAAEDVRRVIGLCGQDAHMFDSTVRENVRLARPEASDDDIRDALRRARVLDWVDSLPAGLDTFVGERGARVSGGQRQRIALARVLLADFPVLVLDEPTADLDPPTADALTADLLAATAGRTTLLITHRLAGLEAVDEIVVLADGRVTRRGAPAAVLPELLPAG
jgi:thiol reductant ABC exporter CydC subunit